MHEIHLFFDLSTPREVELEVNERERIVSNLIVVPQFKTTSKDQLMRYHFQFLTIQEGKEESLWMEEFGLAIIQDRWTGVSDATSQKILLLPVGTKLVCRIVAVPNIGSASLHVRWNSKLA